jgi:putative ABC transport system permease protein
MFKIAIHYALRNISRTPLRSFFTIFSIAMIISMYTLLSVIADSFTEQMNSIVKAGDIDIIIQSKFSATPLSSSISQDLTEKIAADPNIKSVTAIVLEKKRLPDKTIVFVFGISDFPAISRKLGLTLTQGKLYKKGKHQLLIAQRLLHNKQLHIGDTISISQGDPYQITGTYNSWISFFNSSIILELEEARTLLHKQNKSNMLFISLKNPVETDTVVHEINQKYSSLSAVKSSDFTGTMGALKNMFYLSDIIAFITLIVASAILINTFLMAIYERTKEIGILNAIGWTPYMIMFNFIIESLLLALIGGIIGFVISMGMLSYIQTHYNNINFYLPQSMDLKVFAYSMAMCIVIGIISAIFPAFYATKVSIAKALRDG